MNNANNLCCKTQKYIHFCKQNKCLLLPISKSANNKPNQELKHQYFCLPFYFFYKKKIKRMHQSTNRPHKKKSLKLKKKAICKKWKRKKCRTWILHIIDKTILITSRHVLQYKLSTRRFAISCTRNLFFKKQKKLK